MQSNNEALKKLQSEISNENKFAASIAKELSKELVGQQKMVNSLLLGMLANGHILLEGLPGLAKTLAIKSLAKTVNGSFSRIQFTPDLLPADLTGTLIYNHQKGEFQVKKGPVFANFILADEINRSPAKVQSALLEAMQERQVTIGENTYKLDDPFLVMASQNPIEQEGTYQLPEAQVDRFLLKILVSYPSREEEQEVLRRQSGTPSAGINPVATIDELILARKRVLSIYLDQNIEKYILDLVFATRNPSAYGFDNFLPLINYGASPRASIGMALASKANAYLQGRSFVIPEDVQTVCKEVMRHRIGLTYEAQAENISTDELIDRLLNKIQVP